MRQGQVHYEVTSHSRWFASGENVAGILADFDDGEICLVERWPEEEFHHETISNKPDA